jgi:DNA helicase HerA-like ATPase
LIDSGLFVENLEDSLDLNILFKTLSERGGGLIVNLKDQSSISRRMIVELILGKLKTLLSKKIIPPLFLFAEEAHLYLRETYWDDIVTRMRHLGLFTTFITNQPNSIQENIFRQVDNLFLFNFINDKDLEAISRISKIDAESLKILVKDLPPKHCLVIGDAVNNFPAIIRTKDLEVKTMGETRLFFNTKMNLITH